MNFGDSMPDASRSGPDDGPAPDAVGDDGGSHRARSLRTQKPLQDIQEIIDKLAAVTQQLRHPAHRPDSVPEPVGLGREVLK